MTVDRMIMSKITSVPAMQRNPALLVCVLVLSGCSKDSETLDRFSRAYTAFSDASFDTRVASIAVIFNDEKQGYWTELRGALDQRNPSNKGRLEHARAALTVESDVIDSKFDDFNSALDKLDYAVGQLVEIANSVRDREHRDEAIGVSQRARQMYSDYTSLRRLYIEAFSRRREVLEGIVADGGNLIPAKLGRLKEAAGRVKAIANEQKALEQQVSSTEDQLKMCLAL